MTGQERSERVKLTGRELWDLWYEELPRLTEQLKQKPLAELLSRLEELHDNPPPDSGEPPGQPRTGAAWERWGMTCKAHGDAIRFLRARRS